MEITQTTIVVCLITIVNISRFIHVCRIDMVFNFILVKALSARMQFKTRKAPGFLPKINFNRWIKHYS